MPILYSTEAIEDIFEYDNLVDSIEVNFIGNEEFKVYMRITKKELGSDILKFSPKEINTKEYWNFLHENFKFCDVSSHYDVQNLNQYFKIKGRLYDSVISELTIHFFKNKKIFWKKLIFILEIEVGQSHFLHRVHIYWLVSYK